MKDRAKRIAKYYNQCKLPKWATVLGVVLLAFGIVAAGVTAIFHDTQEGRRKPGRREPTARERLPSPLGRGVGERGNSTRGTAEAVPLVPQAGIEPARTFLSKGF